MFSQLVEQTGKMAFGWPGRRENTRHYLSCSSGVGAVVWYFPYWDTKLAAWRYESIASPQAFTCPLQVRTTAWGLPPTNGWRHGLGKVTNRRRRDLQPCNRRCQVCSEVEQIRSLVSSAARRCRTARAGARLAVPEDSQIHLRLRKVGFSCTALSS